MIGTVAMIPLGNPAALWFALAAASVIAAFFFRYRSRVQEIPALSHWVTIGRPIDVRSTATLLRRLLSLVVQILLIALLVFCLANPFPDTPAAHRVAIVIDTSATMQTAERGGRRFGLAVQEARKILRGLPRDTQVYLISAAPRPVSLNTKGMNPASAMALLDTLRPGDTDADLPAAIRAVSFLSDDLAAKVVIISDFAGTTAPSSLASLWHGLAALSLIPVGTDQADCAIIASWAEPDQQAWQIKAEITSRGMAGQSIMARLMSNKQTVVEKRLQLKDGSQRLEFRAVLPAGAAYEIALNTSDALAVDDRAFGVLPLEPNICLVTEGDPPLDRAIRANPEAKLRIVSHEQYNGAGDATVLVVDGPRLREPDPRAGATQGKELRGYLFINTPDPFGFVNTGPRVDVSSVSHWRGDHQSLAEIDPEAIHFHLATLLYPSDAGNLVPLLSAGRVPLISELRRDNPGATPLRMIYWAFGLSDTDLASRLSFPILLWDTIDYLAGAQDGSAAHATGRPLMLPYSVTQVLGPDGRSIAVQPMSTGFLAMDTTEQGIYTIRTGQQNQLIAINLLSARGTLALPRDRAGTSSSATSVFTPSAFKLNWRTLLELALAFAAIEWILFHWRVLRIG